jgi:hypothetical protein
MEKFTKILENKINEKYFEVYADIRLILKSDNDGEAGYKSDLILGSINEQVDFTVSKINELSKEEYKKYFEKIEYYPNKQPFEPDTEYTDEEKILKTWEAEFGDRIPKSTEKMEFYHQMRNAGFDGKLIFKILKSKINI